MELLLATLVLGIVQGAVNALLGAGIVAVYRGTGVINFAHGAMAMTSTYVFVTLVDHGAPSFLGIPSAAVVAVLVGIGLGVAVDVAVMRPLARQSALVRIIATLGVLYVLQSLAIIAFGGATRSVPQIFPAGGHAIGPVDISNNEIGILLVAVLLALALTLFYRRTRFGTAIRAVASSRDAATLVGIRVKWVTAASWAVGGATGAVAGILVAPSLGLNSYILTLLVIQAFAAALTGRLENLALALAGGLGLGVVTAIASTYLSQWLAAHPLSWVNIGNVGNGIAFLWIIALLLVWRRPATTMARAHGSVL
ncbi:MAG TPA: branched-chain amino acid ABC transporter permease [Candidatus Dormibacteraeota bacterium]|nr:branched-chain amino acid ABC transporter permease [Candidatus Dormibacteraeota bacterium]